MDIQLLVNFYFMFLQR